MHCPSPQERQDSCCSIKTGTRSQLLGIRASGELLEMRILQGDRFKGAEPCCIVVLSVDVPVCNACVFLGFNLKMWSSSYGHFYRHEGSRWILYHWSLIDLFSHQFSKERAFVEEDGNYTEVEKGLSMRTLRIDPLDSFKKYKGGYNITSKHYWSVNSLSPKY
ncbi:hypothetical protein ZIOFF_000677 [Zingiber officinale]|uniref:Uncharacterized protein n=1 Tax=Zingiber officinale TaxID=94328 RepID=A0A8J5II37_ZINOF|nr:hypothetical protein ZIOFF_000677 [Zingiber officinale]